MPHYIDGQEAKVGDVVVGTTYNVPGKVVGILASITNRTADTCNCTVLSLVRVYDDNLKVVGVNATDYTECKALKKLL